MTDGKAPEQPDNTTEADTANASTNAESAQAANQSGPTFTKQPDPLAGVKKGATDILDSMEGKTVSMKTYVGSIIGVIVLMLLARCGG